MIVRALILNLSEIVTQLVRKLYPGLYREKAIGSSPDIPTDFYQNQRTIKVYDFAPLFRIVFLWIGRCRWRLVEWEKYNLLTENMKTSTRLLCQQFRHYTECIITEQVTSLHSINVLVYGDEQVSLCEVAVHTKTLWCGSWPAVQTAEADRAHGGGLLQHSRDGLQQRVPLGHVLARTLQHLQPVVAACADEVGPDSQTAHQLVRADPVNIVTLILVHLEW